MSQVQYKEGCASTYEFDTAIRYPLAGNTYDVAWRYAFDFFSSGQALNCRPGDKVLDFAGGTGFVSEMLNRLGVHTVTLDLRTDMLKVGQARLACDTRLRPENAEFCCADGQRIPFADASFDGLVCMNALHHMPDYYLTIAEICRVLKPGCRAVFSEPGSEHSNSPESQRVMREFGEIEKDVALAEIYTIARQVGFTHVYLLPFFSPQVMLLDLEAEHISNNQSKATRDISGAIRYCKLQMRRVFRALRGHLQVTWNTQETHLPNSSPRQAIVRFFQNPENQQCWADAIVKGHPIFALEKPGERRLTSARPGLLRARIKLLSESPVQTSAQVPLTFRVRVTNTGDTLWLAAWREYGGHVTLGVKLSYADGRLISDGLDRASLPHDVAPGETIEITHTVTVPHIAPGDYVLTFDMVDEQVCWFQDRGSKVTLLPIEVQQVARGVDKKS